jgi:hypothetical protein
MNKRLTIYILILLYRATFAQWEYEGKTIGFSWGTGAPAITNVGNGATVVIWNSLIGSDYEIFAQYIDSAGYTRWGEYGMQLFDDDANQGHQAVLSDGEGGAFAVWADGRHTWDEGVAIYGQRIDSLGNLLWDYGGRRLTADTRDRLQPQIYDDGHGGFITVYRLDDDGADIGAQRSDGNGNILWDSAGIILVTAPNYQLYPRTCRASDSTFITCWVDARTHDILDHDIYMQRFNIDGYTYWGANGHAAVSWEWGQGYLSDGHDIVADGHGGAVVVWVDGRHYFENRVLYADRFSPSGQSLWQPNGMQLGDEQIYEALGCQAFRVGSNFMFSWVASGGVFKVSYLDINGDFIWNDPVVLDTMTTLGFVLTDNSGIFYYLTHYSENGQLRKKGVKIDTLGNRYWEPLPYVGYYMLGYQMILDGYGGMIVVWKEIGTGALKISRIYADGHVGGDTTTAISSDEEGELSNSFKLFQNHPNPFNARTRVSLQLTNLDPAKIGLYDLLGRQVKNIFEGSPQALSLEFDIDLSSNEYSSGIYFIVAEQGGQRRVVKSTLLK